MQKFVVGMKVRGQEKRIILIGGFSPYVLKFCYKKRFHTILRRSFQSRGRDRPNRFGGGNRNTSSTTTTNGPTVNGKLSY